MAELNDVLLADLSNDKKQLEISINPDKKKKKNYNKIILSYKDHLFLYIRGSGTKHSLMDNLCNNQSGIKSVQTV
jgi:hypothetical protein